jgi:hypothetical protein
MKVVEKIAIAKRAIESISQHDDAEAAYVETALDKLNEFIASERESMRKRRSEKWKAEIKAGSAS